MRGFIHQQVTRFPRADQLELRILNSELSRAKVMRVIGIGALAGWVLAKPTLAPLFGNAINLWTVLPDSWIYPL